MNWSEWLNETLKGIQGWSIKSDSNHIMVIKLNQCQILMQVLNNADELFSINVIADANYSQYSREGKGFKFSPKTQEFAKSR